MQRLLTILILCLFMLTMWRTVSAEASATTIISTFDSDTEGWTEIGDGSGPFWVATGGNPDGHIRVSDNQSSVSWYFGAPPAFLGDVSSAYGSTLSFDLRQSATSNQFSSRDEVTLIGAGMTLIINTHIFPATTWTHYEVVLLPEAGWSHIDTNEQATEAELLAVLSALDELRIRGEFRTGGDTGYLDNVILDLAPAAPNPITYTVNTTDDSDDSVCDMVHCSLREAINSANANWGHDTILFDQTIMTPTIAVSGTLPTITDPITLDGDVNGTKVVLDGSSASGDGLYIHTFDSTIRNLVIHSFPSDGIYIRGYGNTIEECYLGTDGSADLGNGSYGIFAPSSNDNIIRNNVISGNNAAGIRFENSDARDNLIENNYIGTDATGTIDLGNTTNGVVFVNAPDNIIRNNLISGNNDNGVYIGEENADRNIVENNLIGTDITGLLDVGNTESGIRIVSGSDYTQIGGATGEGNLIAGNNQYGIYISSDATDFTTIEGNKIGTDSTGNSALPNNRHGIWLSAADSTIIGGSEGTTVGGACTGACNLISGNGTSASYRGIETSNSANATIIAGNYVGTNISGTVAIPNANYGIFVDSSNNYVIGGADEARNVISGNACHGLRIEGTGHLVENNYIGVAVDGVTAMSNGCSGIRIDGSSSTFSENVISANTSHGIWFQGNEDFNVISENLIGVGVDGSTPLGNGLSGVQIDGNNSNWTGGNQLLGNTIANSGENGVASSGTRVHDTLLQANHIYSNTLDGVRWGHTSIGNGNVVGADNVIMSNGGNGVTVVTTQKQAVQGSVITGNGGLSIDLGDDGATGNDPDDPDNGANNLQNYPTIVDAASYGGSTFVIASLDTVSNTVTTFDFYSATVCDGTVERYLGDTTALTDANGDVTVQQALAGYVDVGEFVLATATDGDGNTSELSACFAVRAASGALTGVVREDVRAPEDAEVVLYRNVGDDVDPLWFLVGVDMAGGDGAFAFNGLITGDYALYVNDTSDSFAPEYFDDADSFATATSIVVTDGLTTTLPTTITLSVGGTITGVVTAEESGLPLNNIQVTALFDNDGSWENYATTATDMDGNYALGNLPGGNYRLYYFDPAGIYSSEYYSDVVDFDSAEIVTVTRATTTPDINAALNTTNPLVDTDGSMASNPCTVTITDGGQIRIRRHRTKPSCQVNVTTPIGLVACTNGETPSDVVLNAENAIFPMVETSVGSGSWTTGLITLHSTWGSDRNLDLTLEWDCGGSPESVDVGDFQLYDPSGFITDATTDEPVVGASVTLYKVPNWRAQTHPNDNGANTCESNLSKPAGADWSQPAPTELGVLAVPIPTQIDPQLTTQLTDADGHYGWDVAAGCWYVVVVAQGYFDLVSPVVGVPTEVTDLDLQLQPLPPTSVALRASIIEPVQAVWVWFVLLLVMTMIFGRKSSDPQSAPIH